MRSERDHCANLRGSIVQRGLLPLVLASTICSGAVTVSPTTLSFGNQVQGIQSGAVQVTLTNGSTKALTISSITTGLSDYAQTNNCASTLPANASCTISVTFTPSAAGARNDTLHVNDSASNSPQNVTLTGTGIAAVTATPTKLTYANQIIGLKSFAQNVTITNNEATTITITSIVSSLPDYSFTTTCPQTPSTLGGNGTCTVSVYFTPAAVGTRSGSLTVSTNTGANPTVNLTGTGVLPAAVTPASLSFAAQALGTSSPPQTVTLTNNLKRALTIMAVAASPADFSQTTNCPLSPNTLASGATCTASVTFSPKSTGTRTGTLSFTDDATNSPQTVTVSGMGNPATLVSLAVTPKNPSIVAGLTQQFTATGTYGDGTTQDLTASATWASSSTGIASINAAGSATGTAQGTTTITAASGLITGSTTLTVTAPQLKSIAVTPANPSLAKGTSQQLAATGTYTDGSTLDITSTVTWSSGDPAIATINGSGLATSIGVGRTSVVATSGSLFGSTNLTVTAAALVSIAVTPAIPGVPLGMQQQFTATGTYTDTTMQDITATVTWSTSQTSVATISAQGLASTAGTGASAVTAALGSIQGSTTLNVTAAILVSIAVSPAAPSIPLGTAQQFTAIGTFSDGTSQDLTATVAWSSSTVAVATIAANGSATSAGGGSSTVTATSGSVSGSAMLTVTPAQLVSIVVTPSTASVAAGVGQQFTASGTFTDGSVQDVTVTGHWSSANASVATISNSQGLQGLASTLSAGSSTITVASGGISGSATVNVTAAALVSITITPQSPSIGVGQTQQFTAAGAYTDGTSQDVTGVVTWSTSNAGVAIISNAAGSSGLATSAGSGTATMGAALNAVSGSTTLTVSGPVAVSLAITPANPAVPYGGFQQFAATATLSDGSTQDVSAQANWSSSAPAAATVNASGGASGVGAGVSTITANYAGLTSSTQLAVAAPVLVSLSIAPANPSIAVGVSQQLSATGTYSNGGTADLTSQVQWTSSSPGVATINAVGSVAGIAAGNTTITAGFGSISATTSVTVNPADLVSISITPSNASLAKGTSQQMIAIATYSDGSTFDVTASAAWTTADSVTATVNSSGLATSGAIGTTTVTATLGAVSGSTGLTVTAAALVSIAVTPAVPNLPLGTQQQFTATGAYSDGTTQDITASVSWTSSQLAVATISNAAGTQGLATSVSTGPTTISATSGSIAGATTLTVTAAVLVSLTISPAAPSIALGTAQQFSALGTFSDGSSQDLTGTVSWNSNAQTVATVNATGLGSSAGVGSTTVTATSANISGSAVLTVTAAQLVSIALNPLTANVAAGTMQQFTALGTFTDGSTQDVTGAGHWSSSNPSAATVSDTPGSQGLASTLSPGATTITIIDGGVSGSAVLNVTAAALVSIAIAPQSRSINAGANQQFNASGTYTDKTVQDITAIVTWTSSMASVAVISNTAGSNGLATSSGPGATTITATLAQVSASTVLTVNAVLPVSLAMTPLNSTVFIGWFQQFAATATLSDGSTRDVTGQSAWSSSIPGVATVNLSGGATGLAAGMATITAVYSGLTASASLSVVAPVLMALSVTPANPTVTVGTPEQFTAMGTYTDGSIANLSGKVQWSSGTPTVAIINGTGSLTAVAAGSSVVTATLGSISASTTLTVTLSQSKVTVVDPLTYSGINSTNRQFRIYYPAGTPVTAPLPIVVIIHGGGWSSGGYGSAYVTPSTCTGDQTIACWLADHGYVVFSIDYTLVTETSSGADLKVSATNTVSSASYTFKQSDVGSRLLATTTSGGWKTGGYNVTAVSNGAAQLDGSPGAVGTSQGSWSLFVSSTLWPAQWQDCNCFLRFLAEQAGVSVPGDPHNIVLMGQSAGGHLAAVAGLSGNTAFATNCDHGSTNYTVKGIVGFSPPTDFVTLYTGQDNAKVSVRNLIGCVPTYGSCNTVALSASVISYVRQNVPSYMSFSGAGDVTIPPWNAQEAQTAFANLNPPVTQQWIELGPAFSHPLDYFYYPNCSSGSEPSPCGAAGSAFQTALPFIQSVTAH